jgi:hypothetical protein
LFNQDASGITIHILNAQMINLSTINSDYEVQHAFRDTGTVPVGFVVFCFVDWYCGINCPRRDYPGIIYSLLSIVIGRDNTGRSQILCSRDSSEGIFTASLN